MIQNTQTTERPRGRPAETQHQDLKTQILDTAEELFSDHGYAATSIRRIAEEADVNPALIHYYFGNKKSLLVEVMGRSLEPLQQAIAEIRNGPDASPVVIARLLLSMAAEHPNIPRLMIREVLLPGGEMRDHFAENLAPQLGGAFPALLNREKSAGRLREDADPAITSMLILAICMFPFIARTLAEPVLGIGYDEEGIALLQEQVSQLLNQGLMK